MTQGAWERRRRRVASAAGSAAALFVVLTLMAVADGGVPLPPTEHVNKLASGATPDHQGAGVGIFDAPSGASVTPNAFPKPPITTAPVAAAVVAVARSRDEGRRSGADLVGHRRSAKTVPGLESTTTVVAAPGDNSTTTTTVNVIRSEGNPDEPPTVDPTPHRPHRAHMAHTAHGPHAVHTPQVEHTPHRPHSKPHRSHSPHRPHPKPHRAHTPHRPQAKPHLVHHPHVPHMTRPMPPHDATTTTTELPAPDPNGWMLMSTPDDADTPRGHDQRNAQDPATANSCSTDPSSKGSPTITMMCSAPADK